MPQYLAPDVYVEEVDTGSKPIEGVSTSIAGVVGVTERGPLNVPILVTSTGEFTNWFGGELAEADYGAHRFLPHAAEGFFTNGGKQLYVTRVIDTAMAAAATANLFDRTMTGAFATTQLLRAAPESTGTAANPPPLVVMPDTLLGVNDWTRIGDGSNAEYRQVAVAPIVEDVLVPLHLPLGHSHDDGGAGNAEQFPRATAGAVVPTTLAVNAGARVLDIDGANADVSAMTVGQLVEIGAVNVGEYRFIAAVSNVAPSSATNTRARISLDAPLALPYAAGAPVQRLAIAVASTANITPAVRSGDSLLFVNTRGGNFAARADLVVLDQGAANAEVRRIGEMSEISIAPPATQEYLGGSIVQVVSIGDDSTSTLTANAAAAATALQISDIRPFHIGQNVLVGVAGSYEPHQITAITPAAAPAGALTIAVGLAVNKNSGDLVVPRHVLTADAHAGASFIALDDRSVLATGSVIQLTDGVTTEFAEIGTVPLPGSPGVWPDPGNIVLRGPLTNDYTMATAQVLRQSAPTPVLARQPSALALAAAAGAEELLIADSNSWAVGDFVRVFGASGGRSYHRVTAVGPIVAPNPAAGDEARIVTLSNPPLARSHTVGSLVLERQPLFNVQALDAGIWGNRLRIAIEDEDSGLVASTTFRSVTSGTRAHFASVAGMEPGTMLELRQANGAVLGEPVKIASVNRGNGEVTFDSASGLSIAQMGAALTLTGRSREFRLSVFRYPVPDPAAPTRSEPALPVEVFRNLSMDVRHSRYFQAVIGDINGVLRLSDRRPEGESWYIRVHDPAQDLGEPARTTALRSLRPGPETLVDVLPTGRRRAARHELAGGFDSIATLLEDHYIGADAADPELRTGLFTLRSVEDISLIACPGRVSAAVQGALIEQCEALRYRFTVLDGPAPPADTLSDVQAQRQQFDTKYAAIYHPWLLIPNPFPGTPGTSQDYSIPPTGHMLGVYARTDIERGVHKAPANEVVLGITGLNRILNKEQQEVLNPYPVNINVIRDFRNASRGIRVYGGRVITSDSDWKYVNVRRLLIFIESSLNRGLQWVVFEPNAEPLWARVRRSISNFLTLAWRNGALEGTKPEEAFFVKCDRTTMTQTDIDSGRLICLVGVAPVKPAEFVIVRIGLWTAHADE